MKHLLKQVISAAGFEIKRNSSSDKELPYVMSFGGPGYCLDFWITDRIAQAWYTPAKASESAEIRELLRLVEPGDRVLEFGAHHGFFTILLARAVGPQGFVLGLEPIAGNAQVAHSQIGLNGLGDTCQVLNLAGSDTSGSLPLNNDSNASVSPLASSLRHIISVSSTTGDELDKTYGPFNVLKLDVEGYEDKVLAGCRTILSRSPKLAIEIHTPDLPKYGSSVAGILKRLDSSQYAGVMIGRSGDSWKTALPFSPSNLTSDVWNVLLKPMN